MPVTVTTQGDSVRYVGTKDDSTAYNTSDFISSLGSVAGVTVTKSDTTNNVRYVVTADRRFEFGTTANTGNYLIEDVVFIFQNIASKIAWLQLGSDTSGRTPFNITFSRCVFLLYGSVPTHITALDVNSFFRVFISCHAVFQDSTIDSPYPVGNRAANSAGRYDLIDVQMTMRDAPTLASVGGKILMRSFNTSNVFRNFYLYEGNFGMNAAPGELTNLRFGSGSIVTQHGFNFPDGSYIVNGDIVTESNQTAILLSKANRSSTSTGHLLYNRDTTTNPSVGFRTRQDIGTVVCENEVTFSIKNALTGNNISGALISLDETDNSDRIASQASDNNGNIIHDWEDVRQYNFTTTSSDNAEYLVRSVFNAPRSYNTANTESVSNAITFDNRLPITGDVRLFGYQREEITINSLSGKSNVNIFAFVDDYVGAFTQSTASAITGIALNFTSRVVTVTASRTLDQIYAFIVATLCQTANRRRTWFISREAENLDFGNWTVTSGNGGDITSGSLLKTFITTSTGSTSGTGSISVPYRDTSGVRVVVNLVSGTRLKGYYTPQGSSVATLLAFETVSATSKTYSLPANAAVELYVKQPGYVETLENFNTGNYGLSISPRAESMPGNLISLSWINSFSLSFTDLSGIQNDVITCDVTNTAGVPTITTVHSTSLINYLHQQEAYADACLSQNRLGFFSIEDNLSIRMRFVRVTWKLADSVSADLNVRIPVLTSDNASLSTPKNNNANKAFVIVHNLNIPLEVDYDLIEDKIDNSEVRSFAEESARNTQPAVE